jgi:hypothetical protein
VVVVVVVVGVDWVVGLVVTVPGPAGETVTVPFISVGWTVQMKV